MIHKIELKSIAVTKIPTILLSIKRSIAEHSFQVQFNGCVMLSLVSDLRIEKTS